MSIDEKFPVKNSTSISELPRKGSIMHNLIKSGYKQQKKSINRFKLANKYFVVPLYRIRLLPLLGLGRIFVLLTTKGRKSCKLRRSPLEYRKIKNEFYLFSSRGKKGDWYQNLLANPEDARIQKGIRSFKPKIREIENKKEKQEILKKYITNWPKAAKSLFGWNPKMDNIENIDLSNLSSSIAIITFYKT